MKDGLIFFDFDGVLFDTVREAYASAVIAGGRCDNLDDVDYNSSHYETFRKLRYLISPAWNYKYLLEVLESGREAVQIKKTYLEKINNAKKSDYEYFETRFFETRSYLKKNDYERWFRLNIPFPFLREVEYLFHNYKDSLYIVTTKDRSTVIKLLDIENIEFNPDRIFDKDDYELFGNKKEVIESLFSFGQKGIFIDDSDKHIFDCQMIKNLKCFQPNWGYVGLDSNTSSVKEIKQEIEVFLER